MILLDEFSDHFEETQKHCARLEIINDRHGMQDDIAGCDALEGFLLKVKHNLAETVPGEVRDAALIASGRCLEHYEIAVPGESSGGISASRRSSVWHSLRQSA